MSRRVCMTSASDCETPPPPHPLLVLASSAVSASWYRPLLQSCCYLLKPLLCVSSARRRTPLLLSRSTHRCVCLRQACFLGFECAMKFLNWAAPNLWWRRGEGGGGGRRHAPCGASAGASAPERSPGVVGSTNTQWIAKQREDLFFSFLCFVVFKLSFQQCVDFEWNLVVPHLRAANAARTHARTQTVKCSHSFLSFFLTVYFFL